MAGSWVYCSQNIHSNIRARSKASAGIRSLPSARYSMMALDWARVRPSSSTTRGTCPAGLRRRKSGVRVSPFSTFTSTQRHGTPTLSATHFTFRQLPEIRSP